MVPSLPQTPLAKCSLHDWANLRAELLMIFDQPVPSKVLRKRGGRHGDFSAWLVRRGSARLTVDGATAIARPGEWLIGVGDEIEQELSPDAHLLSLRFRCAWPSRMPLFSGSPVQILSAAANPKLERFALALLKIGTKLRMHNEMENPQRIFLWQTQLDFPTYLRYERTLLAWMSAFTQAMIRTGRTVHSPGEVDPRLVQACELIDSSRPSGEFPQKELEQKTGLKIGWLNRLSSDHYGFTIHRYWEQRRVTRARLALEQPETRVKEVAADLGFVQLSHFSNWFKRQTGTSPREFRARMTPGG